VKELVGLRIQITIDEDGTPTPPILPPGTVVRGLTGTDGFDYHWIHLDAPVTTLRAKTREEWVLRDLIVTPHFSGVSLEDLDSRVHKRFIHLRLMNPRGPLSEDMLIFDPSTAAYFALGIAKRI
jgi:hypothetical protein